jgi:hypothetical protein
MKPKYCFLAVSLAGVLLLPLAIAQTNDINRAELRNFDQFLDSHPEIRSLRVGHRRCS